MRGYSIIVVIWSHLGVIRSHVWEYLVAALHCAVETERLRVPGDGLVL